MGRLLARVIIGGLFAGHGLQKLFGWFDGPGPDGTAQMMGKLELQPAKRQGLAAGLAEAGGGTLFAAGALTPLAGAAITGTMVTAIRKVHLPNGLWVTGGGYEYNLVLIAAVAALIESGPGPLSVDKAIGFDSGGSLWAAAAAAAGAAGSALAIDYGARAAAASDAAEREPERPRFEREAAPAAAATA